MRIIKSLVIAVITSVALASCGGGSGGGEFFVKFKYGENSVEIGTDNPGWSSSGGATTAMFNPRLMDSETDEENANLTVQEISDELEKAAKAEDVIGKEFPVEFEQGSVTLDEGATCKITAVEAMDTGDSQKKMFGNKIKVSGTITGKVGGVDVSEATFTVQMYDGKDED